MSSINLDYSTFLVVDLDGLPCSHSKESIFRKYCEWMHLFVYASCKVIPEEGIWIYWINIKLRQWNSKIKSLPTINLTMKVEKYKLSAEAVARRCSIKKLLNGL